MHILHGTWIPDENDAFYQSGQFCLWAETVESGRRGPRAVALPPGELAALLVTELGIGRDAGHVRRTLQTYYFLLPETDGQRLPSPELARAAELDPTDPDSPIVLQSQPVCCYVLAPDVLARLKDLHFLCEYRLADVRSGADVEFWYRISRELARVVAKDQYIPALKYGPATDSGRGRGRRKKGEARFEVYPGWEIVSDDLEQAIRQAKGRMPLLCMAGAKVPHKDLSWYDSEGLLRHFCECTLDLSIVPHNLPAVFTRRIHDTLLEYCLRLQETDEPHSGD